MDAALLQTVRGALDRFLDLLYPPRCLICTAWDAPPVCDDCHRAFWPVPEPSCVVCGRPNEPETVCRACVAAADTWGGWAFQSARAAGIYQGALRHGLHRFKYRGTERLGEPLGAFLANRLVADGLLDDPAGVDLVLPLPSAAARERRRGYNPARLLARPVAEMLGRPLAEPATVARNPVRRTQVGLSPEARRTNVAQSAFVVHAPEAVAGRRILVVDDVLTTGATVQALAMALRERGAARVDVATLTAGG